MTDLIPFPGLAPAPGSGRSPAVRAATSPDMPECTSSSALAVHGGLHPEPLPPAVLRWAGKHPLLLPGDTALLSGRSGIGRSTLALQTALAAADTGGTTEHACGTDFIPVFSGEGDTGLEVRRETPVFFCSWDGRHLGLQAQRILHEQAQDPLRERPLPPDGEPISIPARLTVVDLSGPARKPLFHARTRSDRITEGAFWTPLWSAIGQTLEDLVAPEAKDRPTALVILDPLIGCAYAADGDHDHASVRSFLAALASELQRLNAAAILVAGDTDEGWTTPWTEAARCVLRLTPTDRPGRFFLRPEKASFAPPLRALRLVRQDAGFAVEE